MVLVFENGGIGITREAPAADTGVALGAKTGFADGMDALAMGRTGSTVASFETAATGAEVFGTDATTGVAAFSGGRSIPLGAVVGVMGVVEGTLGMGATGWIVVTRGIAAETGLGAGWTGAGPATATGATFAAATGATFAVGTATGLAAGPDACGVRMAAATGTGGRTRGGTEAREAGEAAWATTLGPASSASPAGSKVGRVTDAAGESVLEAEDPLPPPCWIKRSSFSSGEICSSLDAMLSSDS
jgi:hypothetical protein